MRKAVLFFAFVLAISLTAAGAAAQTETGQIVGTVTDPSGAVVAGAKITVTGVGTGTQRTATSDERGNYVVTNLLPAVYEVTVEAQGFAKWTRRVQVTVGSKVPFDVALTVGAAAQVVEVVAEAGVSVNTETQTLGQVIDQKKILELPTLTRNPYALIATSGNVSDAADAGVIPRGGGFQVNGLRAASNTILLDGAANNDEFVSDVGIRVPLDAVQEFSVLTNNFTAEFGRAAGGVVNVATRSGTNDYHGSAYWFGRYSALASNTFENNANGIDKSVFTRNQFGYSIGGPAHPSLRNKLFFFQSTEWTRIRSNANQLVIIPHADLIAASNPATQGFFTAFGTLRSGFQPLQTFTRSQLSNDPCGTFPTCGALPATTRFFTLGQYSVPTNSGGGFPQNTYNLVGRVDWNISNNTQFYGRYVLEKQDFFEGTNVNSPYAGFDGGAKNTNNNMLVSLTHTFNPRLVTQTKAVFNRLNNLQPLGQNPVGPTLYMFGTSAATVEGQLLAFPGYSQFTPGNAIPFGGPQNFVQLYEDVSYILGRHQFRFGGAYVYIRDNRSFGAYQEAVETLSTTSFAAGVENFLLGQLKQFQAAVEPQGKFPCGAVVNAQCTVNLPVGQPDFSRSNRYHEFSFYVQDSWKYSPRLTFNLGLRWEYFGIQHNKDPKKDSNYYDAVGGSIFQNIRNGDVAIVPNSPIGGLWKKDYNNWAPRLGFAWDVFGTGKTSLRGGFSLGYERNFGNVTFNVIQNPPSYAVLSLTTPTDIASIPITTSNAGPLAGSTGSRPLPRVSLRNVDSNIRTAFASLWSLTVEHEVIKNVILAVDYSGSNGDKLYTLENPNRTGAGNVYLSDPVAGGLTRLRTTQYTNINRRGGNGDSLYHGLNVRVDLTDVGGSGVNLRSNYTWSHALDNLSTTFSESNNNFNLGLLDPFDPKLDRGNADFDTRHRWVLSGTWDIPFARNVAHNVWKRVLEGWTIAPILVVRSGTPFTLFDCLNAFAVCPRAFVDGAFLREGDGGAAQLATDTPNTFRYLDFANISFHNSTFNPAVTDYAHPIVGISDFGPFPANMIRRNAFRGPGAWNLDLGVLKTTKINERFSIQFRAEFFNAFNHSNLYFTPNDNEINSVAFVSAKRGVHPVNVNETRNIQMALKLLF